MDIDRDFARDVIRAEAEAVAGLVERVGDEFVAAAEAIVSCSGRVVATGMGKAGIIAQKIAATLSSTGTSAIFMHPAEARHGDLGLVMADDVVLALSNSGETEELIELMPPLRQIGSSVILMTGNANSALAGAADHILDMGRVEEAGELKLAPTASSTAMLALGDALALAIQKAKGFDEGHYAFYHGGGALAGKALNDALSKRKLTKVSDLMRTGDRAPTAHRDASVDEVLHLITGAHAGSVIVVDDGGKLLGIFTDGDFRRSYIKHDNIHSKTVGEVMTSPCVSIRCDQLLGDAQQIMNTKRINELPVVDDEGRVAGMLDVQDVVDARPFR